MEVLIAFYVAIAFVVALVFGISWLVDRDLDSSSIYPVYSEERVNHARLFLLFPVWPVILLYLVVRSVRSGLVRDFIRDVRGK